MSSQAGKTTIAALFRNREDAHRAVIELREVEFPTDTIGAAFREGHSASTSAPAVLHAAFLGPDEIAEPTNSATNPDPLLPPETPMTTLTGGSPFGEASTYKPPSPAEEDWWEGMRVALPHARAETAVGPANSAKSKKHPARILAEPMDINFDPADRPGPAYDNDYEVGDYSYEVHAFNARTLAATLAASGLDSEQANVIARKIGLGDSIVTVITTTRIDEALSILTRNNGIIADSASEADPAAANSSASGSRESNGRLHLYGEALRCHLKQSG